MTNAQITRELQEAKASKDPQRISKAITQALRPEAKEAIRLASNNHTTKNGYGTILQFASLCSPYQLNFIHACVLEGYDPMTASQIKEMI